VTSITQPKTETAAALRADARRNRKRVLQAAREEFARHGLEAQVDEIARKAKVGVGTVYRHFPTKYTLAEAIAADYFAQLAGMARLACEEPDPWKAFAGFMREAAAMQAGDLALTQVISAVPEVMHEAARCREDLHEAIAELVARAQKVGELRKDVVSSDVPMLMCSIGRASRPGEPGPSDWERLLAIVLDGLRAAGKRRAKLPAPRGGSCQTDTGPPK
jgi:AcrR family transcriptional regulator